MDGPVEERLAALESLVADLVKLVASSSVQFAQARPEAPIRQLVQRAESLQAP